MIAAYWIKLFTDILGYKANVISKDMRGPTGYGQRSNYQTTVTVGSAFPHLIVCHIVIFTVAQSSAYSMVYVIICL